MKIRLILFIAPALLFLNSCKKDEKDPPVSTQPAETVLNEDVAVMSELDLEIQLSESDFESGTLVFENYDPQTTPIDVGSVLVGQEGEGYIRKVLEKEVSGTQITVLTEQATMEDVFESGEFGFEIDFDNFEHVKSFNFALPDTNLYSNGPLSIDLQNANLTLDPNWHLDFKFEDSSLDYFEFSTQGSEYAASADVVVSASQSITLLDKVDTLSHHRKKIIKWVQAGYIPVPVVIVTNLYWLAEYNSTLDAEVSATTNIANSGDLTLGVKYEESKWEGLYNFNTESLAELTDLSGTVNANLKMNLRPLVTLKLYGIVGPEMSVGLMSEGNAAVSAPDLNWDFKADVWMETTAGARADILGKNLLDFSLQVWESEKATYRIPDKIEYVSGNNQDGAVNQQLFEPLVVRVKDALGNPIPNVPVFFEASNGNGSISPESVLTDEQGLAEGIWTLGEGAQQTAKATAKYGNNDLIMGAPVNFNAAASETSPCGELPPGTVCNPVTGRIWMDRNLGASAVAISSDDQDSYGGYYQWGRSNTEFTPEPDEPYDWSSPPNDNYWQGVNGLNNPCPSGFRIPTIEEWIQERESWSADNSIGAFQSPLKLTVAGDRDNDDGSFNNIGIGGHYWSSTPDGDFSMYIYFALDIVTIETDYRARGYSCRCIMD